MDGNYIIKRRVVDGIREVVKEGKAEDENLSRMKRMLQNSTY